VARRRSGWSDVQFRWSNDGWMWPGVAQCLWSLAPSLAPRDLVSGANVRRFRTSPSNGEVAAIERPRSARAGPARRLAIGSLSAVKVTPDCSVDGSLLDRGFISGTEPGS
jgi:hypothetical protein